MANVKLSERGKAFLKRGNDASRVADYLVKEGRNHITGERFVVPINSGSIAILRSNSSTKREK